MKKIRMKQRMACVGLMGSIALAMCTQAAVPLRTEECLNGIWELKVDGDDKPAEVRVPGSYGGQGLMWAKDHWNVWDYPTHWDGKAAEYRRSIQIPDHLDGQRVLIHFGGVRHVVRVVVNGEEVGTWSDSYVPFSFDITDQVHAGENELRVGIAKDRTCGLYEDYNDRRRGIYQDVFLKFVPDVRVTPDIYIQTSVTNQMMTCEVPVRNDSDASQTFGLRFQVIDADGKVAKRWGSSEKMTVVPGEVKTMTVSESWKNPHLWSLDDPNLYHLETEVVTAENTVLDRHRLRFGFREITWKNQHLYLNGNELFLRGHGGHPQGDLQHTKEYAKAWIRQLKEQGVDLMRLHDFPRDDALYDAADEMGFFFLSEAAHHQNLPPKEIALPHTERMVKRLRNRPSVLMWSVANELHWKKIPEPTFLIERCNELDPTRPAFNSDFSAWSVNGDVVAHHYSASSIWTDWEKYGPDKVMVWDEIGHVWGQDRPLKTGPAGLEISLQDVQTGTWRDGWEKLRMDIEGFVDGKEMNGRFYRVNAYVPWELSYNFYRFQPFNNFQRLDLEYDQIEGTKGLKLHYINPCATTINIWDPTLPENQPNPALYCFNEFMERVRFPDDPKERTFFSGTTIQRSGRLFFEDHRLADQVEFRVETPEGKVLTSQKRKVALKTGEYVPVFESGWKLPKVDTVTPVRLVRQFSYKGETGYRQVDDVKVFPAWKPVDLKKQQVAVVGEYLQKRFGGAGVALADARMIVAEAFDPAWDDLVANGVRVLVQSGGDLAAGKQRGHYNLIPKGPSQGFSGSVKNHALPEGLTLSFGTPGQERSSVSSRSFNIKDPVAGAWVTLRIDGTIDFSQIGLVQLGYGLWTPPGDIGYDKSWENAGGAPFFRKTVRLMISDESGRWFVSSEKDAAEMRRDTPTAFTGALDFDCSLLSWKPVDLESGAVVLSNEKATPDFSRIAAVGFLFDESNPESQVQVNTFGLRGAKPDATVQPGSVQHQLLTGLGQEDFSFWRGGSSTQVLKQPRGRNVRRIILGNTDGMGSALQETFIGRGVVLESALNLGRFEEPAAGFMLNRMVDYLNTYQAGTPGQVAVVGGSRLKTWLTQLGADIESSPSASDVIAVDARDAQALAAAQNELIDHLAAGGTVWFSEVTPETIDTVRAICDQPLRLTEPFFGQRYRCIKAPVSWARVGSPTQWVDYFDGIMVPYPFEPNFSPLLAGIANADLDWDQATMFRNGIEIEGMNPVSASADHQVLISNWHIGSEPSYRHLYGEQLNGVRDLRQNCWFVNRDPVVMELSARGGRVLISQLALPAGGEKAQRVMQTMLTNLGVSFQGAMPASAAAVYDSAGRKDQLERFAVYDRQIDPVQRQYYGTPNPMPDYLNGTEIMAKFGEEQLPLMGFFGDSLTLGLTKPLKKELAEAVELDPPVLLKTSSQAVEMLSKQIGDKHYARVVFSLGEADLAEPGLTPEEFQRNLEAVWKVLAKHSAKIYWVPMPSEFGNDALRAAKARELNQLANVFFEGKDVYKIPFVYADLGALPTGYCSGDSEKFSPAEAKALSERLAEAVISFGAQ